MVEIGGFFDAVAIGDERRFDDDTGGADFAREFGNARFVGDDVLGILIVLRIEEGVEELVGVGDGLARGDCGFGADGARDVSDEKQIALLRLGDDSGIDLRGNRVEDFEGVVAGVGLLVDSFHAGLNGARAEEDWAGGEDGGAEQFSFVYLFAPEEMSGASVEVEDRGDAIGDVERKLVGGEQVDVGVDESGDEELVFSADDLCALRRFGGFRRTDGGDLVAV